jgi:hypothetical protein
VRERQSELCGNPIRRNGGSYRRWIAWARLALATGGFALLSVHGRALDALLKVSHYASPCLKC